MDLPLEALKMIAQAVPIEGDGSHALRWTPENGFVLGILWGGQWYDIRFDFDDKLESIKEEITTLTGIPMPEQKKKEKKEGPPMGKEASRTPLLDGIKEAVLGDMTYAQSAATIDDRAGRGTSPSRTSRPSLFSRLSDFRTRALARSVSARNR